MKRQVQLPLALLAAWFDDKTEFLTEFNEALRNINRGRNDHLPYYETIPGYVILMMSELKPRGDNRPPSVGRWQLIIQRVDREYELVLQGLVKDGAAVGELVVLSDNPSLVQKFEDTQNKVQVGE